jgi:hypothetical protein
MLNVAMLSVAMLNGIMLSVAVLNAIMLCVIMLSVVAPTKGNLSHKSTLEKD